MPPDVMNQMGQMPPNVMNQMGQMGQMNQMGQMGQMGQMNQMGQMPPNVQVGYGKVPDQKNITDNITNNMSGGGYNPHFFF